MALEVRDCLLAVYKVEPHFPCHGTLLQASFPQLDHQRQEHSSLNLEGTSLHDKCSFKFIGFEVDPNQKQHKVDHNSRQLVFSFADNG